MPAAKTPYYITTATSYPNGAPHIGDAYEAIARFERLDGFDVFSFQRFVEEEVKA